MILNIKGSLREFTRTAVMGIINVTPDSFYGDSRFDPEGAVEKCGSMLRDGADIIDVGGCSTRPGSDPADAETEMTRVVPVVERLRDAYPDVMISVDTFRSCVASEAVAAGADIINDVSGGTLDAEMYDTVASLRVPYILGHMRGTPQTMSALDAYEDVTAEVLGYLSFRVAELRGLGVSDIIVDPCFGFAKNIGQNFRLLSELGVFHETGCPVLAGLSRKSMISKTLGTGAEECANGTTALNMAALMNGADILRVHDVREAAECVKLYGALRDNSRDSRSEIRVTDKDGGHTTIFH